MIAITIAIITIAIITIAITTAYLTDDYNATPDRVACSTMCRGSPVDMRH